MRSFLFPRKSPGTKPRLGTPLIHDGGMGGLAPILFLPFLEGSGGTVADLAGNNYGTVQGPPVWTPNRFGETLALGGTTYVQSQGLTPVCGPLGAAKPAGVTIAFWLYITPNSNTNSQQIAYYLGVNRAARDYAWYGSGTTPLLTFMIAGVGATAVLLTTGAWRHVAVTQDLTKPSPFPVAVYLDGVQASLSTNAGAFNILSPAPFGYYVGGAPAVAGVIGAMDLFTVWPRALNAAEIKQIFLDPLLLFGPEPIDTFMSLGTATRVAVAATGYTLAGSSTATAGDTVTYALESVPPTGTYTGGVNTVTLTDHGAGGVFLDANGGALAGNQIALTDATGLIFFRYATPATPTAGIAIDAATNSAGFVTPNAPPPLPLNTQGFVSPPFIIDTVNYDNSLIWWSPGNWRKNTMTGSYTWPNGTTVPQQPFAQTNNAGACIDLVFQGASLAIVIDTMPLVRGGVPQVYWPKIGCRVDNGPDIDRIVPLSGIIPLWSSSVGTTTTPHQAHIDVVSIQETYDRWVGTLPGHADNYVGGEALPSPPSVVRVLGFLVATDPATYKTSPPPPPLDVLQPRTALIFGDSIVEGAQVFGMTAGQGTLGIVTAVDAGTGAITGTELLIPGYGYVAAPQMLVADAPGHGGTGASVIAVLAGDATVGALTIAGGGTGYAQPGPWPDFSGNGGSGAVGYCNINQSAALGPLTGIWNVIVTQQGSGYPESFPVTIRGGSGSGALVTARADALGHVVATTVTAPGSGYVPGPTLTAIAVTTENQTNDARRTYAALVALGLRCRYGQIGYGGSGWSLAGSGGAQALYNVGNPANSAYCNYDQSHSRLDANGHYSPLPDLVIIEHGANDHLHTDQMAAALYGGLPAIRAAAPGARIIQLIPASGIERAVLTQALAAFRIGGVISTVGLGGAYTAPGPIGPDPLAFLVDPGTDLEPGIAGSQIETPPYAFPLGPGPGDHGGTLAPGTYTVALTVRNADGNETLASPRSTITLAPGGTGSIQVIPSGDLLPTSFGSAGMAFNIYCSVAAGSATLALATSAPSLPAFITALPLDPALVPPTVSFVTVAGPNPAPSYQSAGNGHPTEHGHARQAARYAAAIASAAFASSGAAQTRELSRRRG